MCFSKTQPLGRVPETSAYVQVCRAAGGSTPGRAWVPAGGSSYRFASEGLSSRGPFPAELCPSAGSDLVPTVMAGRNPEDRVCSAPWTLLLAPFFCFCSSPGYPELVSRLSWLPSGSLIELYQATTTLGTLQLWLVLVDPGVSDPSAWCRQHSHGEEQPPIPLQAPASTLPVSNLDVGTQAWWICAIWTQKGTWLVISRTSSLARESRGAVGRPAESLPASGQSSGTEPGLSHFGPASLPSKVPKGTTDTE